MRPLPPLLAAPAVLLVLLTGHHLDAADSTLRLGPEEFVAGGELANVQMEHSSTRVDDAVLHPYIGGRFFNIGLELDAFLALGDDDRGAYDVDTGDLTEYRVRLDYLVELPDLLQIVPFFEYDGYVELDEVFDEDANWLGVDVWYLTPVEGLEVGGNLAWDLGDEYGWYLAAGTRQFYQNAPLDLRTWQMFTAGDSDYHRWVSGADQSGLTTIELGGEATLPMPWQQLWATVRAEAHVWLQEDDRDAIDEDLEFVMALGVQYRL